MIFIMKTLSVSKLGKANVIVDIVPKGNYEIRPAYYMNPSAITIHNTGNSGKGANAEAHNRYIHNMANLTPKDTGYASWHFSVDDKHIYQHIPLDESAWHTGDGSGLKSGNRTSIGIEICENVDMEDYHQAEENAIALTVYLMKTLGISTVRTHQSWSGKYCPRVILGRDGTFDKFHNRIMQAKAGAVSVPSSTSSSVDQDIKGVQEKLVKLHYILAIDGIKGKDTTSAIMDFQSKCGIAVDGLVGKDTLAMLDKALNSPYMVGKILVDVWSQEQPNFSPDRRVKVLKKDSEWKVYGLEGNYYQVGTEYVHKAYMEIVRFF